MIDVRYDDALATADNIAKLRNVVRATDTVNVLHATFIPKPISKIDGSRIHTRLSLFTEDGENIFQDDGTAVVQGGISPRTTICN